MIQVGGKNITQMAVRSRVVCQMFVLKFVSCNASLNENHNKTIQCKCLEKNFTQVKGVGIFGQNSCREACYVHTFIDIYNQYADNPKISTIYVVRELLGFKSD